MTDDTLRFDPADISSTKAVAWLSYVGILFLIPMLMYRNSPYTKYHVNQGIGLFIIGVILNLVQWVLGKVPVLGLLLWIVQIVLLVFCIMGIVYAATGKAKRLPIVGEWKIYQ